MGKIESVTLREKSLKDGRKSLYLDYYAKGERKYEFLRLYYDPKNSEEKKRVKKLANAIRSQREVDIQNNKFGFESSSDILFIPYARSQDNTKIIKHLLNVYGEKTMLSDLDKASITKFKKYLEGLPLKQNTKADYWVRFAVILHRAEKEGYYDCKEFSKVEGIKREETERPYLVIDEIHAVANAELLEGEDNVRRMFMFSCCTGLRLSDVLNLKWGDIEQEGDNYRIIFRQVKTKGQEYMDMSPSALDWLPERGKDTDHVFKHISQPAVFKHLQTISGKAGLKKHISFHVARHSFACMMIDLNVDLYTISKLLGHRNIQTTQIYAKIRDKQKKEAVAKIPSFVD